MSLLTKIRSWFSKPEINTPSLCIHCKRRLNDLLNLVPDATAQSDLEALRQMYHKVKAAYEQALLEQLAGLDDNKGEQR